MTENGKPGARGRPIDERARHDRRQQILAGARICFVARGFHAASVSEISAAAGVSNANIYQYFDNKEALIVALIADQMAADAALIEAVADTDLQPDELRTVFAPLFETDLGRQNAVLMCERMSEASRNPVVATLAAAAEEHAIDLIDRSIRKVQARGVVPATVDPPSAAVTLTSVFDRFLQQLLIPGNDPLVLLATLIDQFRRILNQQA